MSQAQRDLIELELMIDRNTIDKVLDALVRICSEKADHIEENYSDVPLAERWRAIAKRIDAVEGL